jgi:hypothetical protein
MRDIRRDTGLSTQTYTRNDMTTPMSDLWLAIDVAVGWVLGRAVWLAVAELVVKPLLFHFYRRVDAALSDNLPDL